MLAMLLKDLRIAPLRSFLTGFSMFIGIIAMLISSLIGAVGKAYLESATEQFFGRTPNFNIEFTADKLQDAERLRFFLERLNDTQEAVAPAFRLQRELNFSADPRDPLPGVSRETQQLEHTVTVEAIYTTAAYNRIYNLNLVAGRWLSSADTQPALEMVLNKAAFRDFQESKTVYASTESSLNPAPFTVVGVVNDGIEFPRLYVNAPAVAEHLPIAWQPNSGTLYWFNPHGHSAKAVKGFVRDLLHDSGGGKAGEIIENSELTGFDEVVVVVQWSFGAIAALLLFVSAVGIINIGLASLEQRAHELLIRRALGATRGSITLLVLGGSLLLAVLVALVAIAVSFLLLAAVPALLPPEAPVFVISYPLEAAVTAVCAAVFTSLVGGIFPALKAAKLQPALALR